MVQQQQEALEAAGKEDATLKDIQKILYSTEVRVVSNFCSHHSWVVSGGIRGPRNHRASGGGRNVLVAYTI